MNTSWGKGVLPRMPSAKNVTKLDIFTKCARARREPPRGPTLFKPPQDDDDTHIDENEVRQPNPPPRVNNLYVVNHIEANRGRFNEGKDLKFPIASNPRGPCNHHTVVRVDTGADVKCMNEKTFNELFPKVQLSVCPHEIQNVGNSVADISILGQLRTYLEFRGEKYFEHLGVLLPNYPKDMVVDGDNVPHFDQMSGDKTRVPNGTSNVFQILGDIQKQQLTIQSQCKILELASPFRTTRPSKPALTIVTAKQTNPVHVIAWGMQNTSWSGPPASCAHVHKPPPQVLKPGKGLGKPSCSKSHY